MPDAPRGLKTRIEGADAILLMTPEHDFSYSGVLKNTIDWASRPPGSNSFVGKPGAIMSASTGVFGGARAQYHLRQVLAGMNMYLRNKPEVMVTMARDKFDQEGTLTDGKTLDHVKALLEAFVSWVKRLRGDAV
jgi:chromate reductase